MSVPRPDQKQPADRPVDRTAGQPADRPAGQPADRPAGQPAERTFRRFLRVARAAAAALALCAGLFYFVSMPEKDTGEAARNLPEGFAILEPEREFSALLEAGDTIYAGGMEGVFLFDLRTFAPMGQLSLADQEGMTDVKVRPGEMLEAVKALYLHTDNTVWVGCQSGIAIFRHGKLIRRIGIGDGLPDGRVNAIIRDGEGRIWAGTFNGAARLEPDGSWRQFTKKDGLMEDMVNQILPDSQGRLWFASYLAGRGGLTCFAGETVWQIGVSEGLSHPSITTLAEDGQGGIWAGGGAYDKGGADCLVMDSSGWQIRRKLSRADGLAGEKVRHIHIGPEGSLWFCSEYDGIAVFTAGEEKIPRYLDKQNGLSDNEVKQIMEDREGNFWLATRSGITRLTREAVAGVLSWR